MGRKRIHDEHLPKRMVKKRGKHYYIDPKQNNKWIPLGPIYTAACAQWAKLTEPEINLVTMNHLFDRYLIKVSPTKSANTHKSEISFMKMLRITFGNMKPEHITPIAIYGFMDRRGKKAKFAANRELALLSEVFNKAIRWGYASMNPCNNIEKFEEKPRKRCPSTYEYKAIRRLAPEPLKSFIWLKYLSGQRPSDLIKIKKSEIHKIGIDIDQSKTGMGLTMQWSKVLKKCIDRILALQDTNVQSIFLFCNSYGRPLTYFAIASMWKRTMRKAIANGIIKERFQLRDLRAKSATDARDLQEASDRLGHTSTKITQRVYIRKRRMAKPTR